MEGTSKNVGQRLAVCSIRVKNLAILIVLMLLAPLLEVHHIKGVG